MQLILAVNPILATWGQVAAIVICFYILVVVLLTLAFNLVMAIALGWLHEKFNLVKMLRPTVDSMNEATQTAIQGTAPDANEHPIIRTVASVPVQVQAIDKRVDQISNRVANTVIEFGARTAQAKAIAKAFLSPGQAKRSALPTSSEDDLETEDRGYHALTEEKAPEVPAEAPSGNGPAQTVSASQL